MNKLYPLTFKTIFKEKIWGGDKIKIVLNKDFSPLANCGETWELSAVEDNVSVVDHGPLTGKKLDDLIKEYKGLLLGEKHFKTYGGKFPLLIKFIDAQEDLSVQVHPNDELARDMHGAGATGKTEMWYIMQADEGASLIAGFSERIDKEEFRRLVNEAKLEQVLNRVPVDKGDVFFIPAGRVHTIGKGILLAEIQQTSDLTYRIYDFDRTDAQGNKRELHVEKAARALDFKLHKSYKTPYAHHKNKPNELVTSRYFTTSKWSLDQEITLDFSDRDSFTILIGLEGEMEVLCDGKQYEFKKGQVYLVPASCHLLRLRPAKACDFLEVHID